MAEGTSLLLSAKRSRVLCGEGLPIALVVRNEGETSITLNVGPTNPIVFELRTHPEGAVVLTRSRLVALLEARGDPSRPLPPDRSRVVGPGESRSLSDDPAAGSSVPIPAGCYLMTARLSIEGDEVVSNAVEIVIESPSVGRFASLFCRYTGSHAQAFDHRGGRAQLYQLEAASERADASVFWPRGEATEVSSLVLAAHVDPRLAGRWLGWLERGSLGAVVGLGAGMTARPPLVGVELSDPVLLEPALQRSAAEPTHPVFNWGEGLFLVAGVRGGAAVIQSFVATREAITPGPVVPLADDTPLPVTRPIAPEGGAPPRGSAQAPTRVLVRWSLHTKTIRLVWAEASPSGTRILARSYSRDVEPLADAPELLYERSSPLAALELEPIGDGRSPGFVHALLGPEGDDPQARDLLYVRIPLDDLTATPEELFVPVPHMPVESYAISGHTSGGLVVLAKVGGTVCRIAARGPFTWRTHITDVPALRHLRVAASARNYWAALGVDPELGILCVPDPDWTQER